ncbi:hypothetical protein BKA58DRAFT_373374 [Alternaria rosae]|uniref:uncharacterized protein n=1 Tax=Alternaria rosae TaxID=1187941 RepID=UPI001E8EB4C9|nr:uncharacterized protein BKA58DRAFT_373374 [Alternaria rosae]KAH6882466.1 hypothetical protein BKA58DRAFT_373374 [Alternaria rosae]
MQSYLSTNKSFLCCLAEGCPSGQIHDTGVAGPIFRCAACGHRMCTAHNPIIPFHEDEVCTQYNERIERERLVREAQNEEVRLRREQEEASIAEVGKSSVECPGYGAQIQKTSGYDHMTCRWPGCRFQFCYRCRAPYKGVQSISGIGNSAHADSCRHHSAQLPNYHADFGEEEI